MVNLILISIATIYLHVCWLATEKTVGFLGPLHFCRSTIMARPAKNPPHGMEDYDLGALSDEQQASLSMYKIKTRMANEDYLRNHPEIKILMTSFLRELLHRRPNNVREFAAAYFTSSELPSSEKLRMLHTEDERTPKLSF